MAQSRTKKVSSKRQPVTKIRTKSTPTTAQHTRVSNINLSQSVNRKYLIIAVCVVVLIAVLYAARSLFIAAIVNGHPISRLSVIKQLEAQGGKQTLDSLVTQTLIQDEAAKRHISVSQSDVDKQIATIQKSIESQGSSLDAALAQQGMTRNDLNQQVKLQLLLNKMVGTPTVTDKEINDYMSQNKDQLPQGTTKDQIKQQLIQQKQQSEGQTLVANLRNKAHITYFVNY